MIPALGPVVQSVVSLTSSLRAISLTVLADSVYNILILFAENNVKSYSHFFSKKFQHICVSLDVNFNESLTNDVVTFEQLGPGLDRSIERFLQLIKLREKCIKIGSWNYNRITIVWSILQFINRYPL